MTITSYGVVYVIIHVIDSKLRRTKASQLNKYVFESFLHMYMLYSVEYANGNIANKYTHRR